jgi:hypothetical protein
VEIGPQSAVTNGTSESQRLKLQTLGIEGLFDPVVISGEAGFRKPDPRIFELAIAGWPKETILFVGDDPECQRQHRGWTGRWATIFRGWRHAEFGRTCAPNRRQHASSRQTTCLDEYICEYTRVPTTIHIPEPLLAEVDKRAKTLNLSRNRFIVDALQKALAAEPPWSPGFLDALQAFTPLDDQHDIAALVGDKRRSRRQPLF